MPKFRDRVCNVCGDVEFHTATHSLVCKKCYLEAKRAIKVKEERAHLERLGYTDIQDCTYNHHGKPVWTFKHSCGTEQSWVYANILKQVASRPNHVPCSKCGGYSRMMHAHSFYMKKYGITAEECVLFDRYSKKVRTLSDKTFKLHQAELNPLGLKRGVHTWHLDHITPIIYGFKNGWAPERLAVKENLQLLPAKTNLSKGRKRT